MLIPVIYKNGKQDMVKDYYLADLIENQTIRRFKRRDGWVSISAGHIRKQQPGSYFGPERRGRLLSEAAN